MCDGKLASKRDVVILSIKPKRPEYPSCQKVVPVSELHQEWDKLDAYYRGQLLKLQKSFSKSKSSHHHHTSRKSSSRHSSPNNQKVSKHHLQKSSYPVVNKKHSSSLSSDQFTELFGDENLFSPASGGADTNNNSNRNHHHHSKNKSNKLLPSRSLNSLFSDDDDDEEDDLSLDELPPPHPPHHKSSSRKSSLSSVNGNLVVSIPVLSVPQNYNKRSKYFSDDDDDNESGVSEVDDDNDNDESENFLSVPRDNFQVQYGLKQKTRVALLEQTGNVSPRFIVPIRVAPYKPPAAQGLNGVQIQKILYHKNDKVNYASPTTTTARTPDKPPDNNSASPPITLKSSSSKVSSVNNSPVNSTVSPRSGTNTVGNTTVVTPTLDNNNATPKQTASRTPELASPQSDQGYKSSSSTSSKLSSPPVNVNSTTGNSSSSGNHNYPPPSSQQNKLKRPISLTESYSSTYGSSGAHGKKQRLGAGSSDHGSGPNHLDRSPSGYNFTSVTSSNSSTHSSNGFPFSSLSSTHSQSKSSSCSSLFDCDDLISPQDTHQSPLSNHRSRHSSTSSSASSASRLSLNNLNNPPSHERDNSVEKSTNHGSSPSSKNSHKKLNIINKNPSFVRPPSTTSSSSSSTNSTSSSSSTSTSAMNGGSGGSGSGASSVDRDHSVFLAPAAVSITDRIIKKASRPQPELIERQRRRRMESNQRKNYALKMGDEHEERESIDLSMKSFEMIWNVPLLSPLRSP